MNTFETIKKILVEQLGVDEASVTEETTIEDLGADSLDLVEIVMSIEEEFSVKVDDSELENLKKVGDLVNYIEDK